MIRNNVTYEMREIGSRGYSSDKYKIPDSDTWRSYAYRKEPSNDEKSIEREINYLSGLIAEISAKHCFGAFGCQFYRWKKILSEMFRSKNPNRSIQAIQKRIHKYGGGNSLVINEIETGISILLGMKNYKAGINYESIDNHLFKLD